MHKQVDGFQTSSAEGYVVSMKNVHKSLIYALKSKDSRILDNILILDLF
jgi:hypothetical protein